MELATFGVTMLETILQQLIQTERLKQEQAIQELQIISDSSLREALAADLFRERRLAPLKEVQKELQAAGQTSTKDC